MSTANHVPETFDLTGEDAFTTARRARTSALVRDSFQRFRHADGFSHSRATAFQLVLTLLPGAIVLVGIAVASGSQSLAQAVLDTTESLAPGPANDVFRDAFEQGTSEGAASAWSAMTVGAIAMLISATTAFGQIERTANRIYGIEADRPPVRKYTHALVLALTAGTLALGYFLAISLGSAWTDGFGDGSRTVWGIVRWPVAGVMLAGFFAIVFKLSPRRRQPGLSWLLVGGLISMACAVLVSILLHLYLNASESFGNTYGPLAGFIGVMLWSLLSSIGLYLGLAFAAQLEAVRAGAPEPFVAPPPFAAADAWEAYRAAATHTAP